MKLALPLLMALATAQPLHGHHDHEKRDLVTVVVTQVVTVNEAGSAVATETASSTALASSYLLSGSSFETVYYSESSTVSAVAPAYSEPSAAAEYSSEAYSYSEPETTTLSSTKSSYAAASSSSTKTSSSSTYSSTSTGGVSYAQGKGITYSPYTSSGSCKTADEITSDVEKLAQFDLIRVYDTDCDCVSTLFSAKASGQKLFLGIYYLDKISDSVSIISDAVSNGGSWDDVHTVSVGNELVNSGTNTVSEIKTAVESARSLLTDAGYSGYVVSVDTLVAVQNNPDLCDYSDYVAVNSHPFWDGGVTADEAGEFLKTNIANIGEVCGGKTVLITETGWPTQGDDYGSAVPSQENQVTALESISSAGVSDQVILFTTYNDYWKSAGTYGVEQYWGIFGDSPE